MAFTLRITAVVLTTIILCVVAITYEPNWTSLDSRPIPNWYDGLKIGILVNWGVYSVPGLGSDKFWYLWEHERDSTFVDYMKQNYPPKFTYADFAPLFKAELFDANYWAELFDAAGAGYVIVSSKHSDGFTMYASQASFNWNSVDVGPNRDLIEELVIAIRNKTYMFFGLSYSLSEWMNPLYTDDITSNFTTNAFVQRKLLPELFEMTDKYKPDIILTDDDSSAPDSYWNSTQFLAWLYNDSPVKDKILTYDRWGQGTRCQHGGVYTCLPVDFKNKKWENITSLDKKGWTFRRNARIEDFVSMNELIATLAETVSYGGNMLISLGPSPDGTIPPICEERLRQLGAWLKLNGQGIYGTRPWKYQRDSETKGVWYTSQKISMTTGVYAILLKWPTTSNLFLKDPVGIPGFTTIYINGYDKELKWTPGQEGGININLSDIPYQNITFSWGWVFELWALKNA